MSDGKDCTIGKFRADGGLQSKRPPQSLPSKAALKAEIFLRKTRLKSPVIHVAHTPNSRHANDSTKDRKKGRLRMKITMFENVSKMSHFSKFKFPILAFFINICSIDLFTDLFKYLYLESRYKILYLVSVSRYFFRKYLYLDTFSESICI